MLLENKKVAIIGGGPGGLTLAKLLQQKGVDVKVYEREIDRNVRIQGVSLDLHTESGLAALEKAGLMDQFKANYRPGADKMRVADNQAKIHFDQYTENTIEKFGHKNFRPEIDRGPLRDILLDALKPDTVVWKSHIVSIEEVGDTWKIIFENGTVEIADLVIGADGANSKIRPFVTDHQPNWSGVTMMEGVVYDSENTAPIIHQLLKGGKIFAFGNEKTLIVSAKGDGNFGFSTGHKTAENWVQESGIDFKDNKQVLAWFKEEYEDWSPIWYELFENEKTLFIPRPQYCMPLDLSWKGKSNITLIGDAAHLMPPFAGEGVNMAMLDALQLSESLTSSKFDNIRAAIANYEQKMFKRFAKMGEFTMVNTRWMHSPKALENMLAMFSKNKLKQITFFAKIGINAIVIPRMKKLLKLAPL